MKCQSNAKNLLYSGYHPTGTQNSSRAVLMNPFMDGGDGTLGGGYGEVNYKFGRRSLKIKTKGFKFSGPLGGKGAGEEGACVK